MESLQHHVENCTARLLAGEQVPASSIEHQRKYVHLIALHLHVSVCKQRTIPPKAICLNDFLLERVPYRCTSITEQSVYQLPKNNTMVFSKAKSQIDSSWRQRTNWSYNFTHSLLSSYIPTVLINQIYHIRKSYKKRKAKAKQNYPYNAGGNNKRLLLSPSTDHKRRLRHSVYRKCYMSGNISIVTKPL